MTSYFPTRRSSDLLPVGNRAWGTVSLRADGVDLVEQRQLFVVERLEVGSPAVGQRDHLVSEFLGALGALAPVLAGHGLDALGLGELLDRLQLGVGVLDEAVDGDHRRHAELLHVGNVAAEVRATLLDPVQDRKSTSLNSSHSCAYQLT